jgi:LmbE family N-acetylglucosaminyl deacetylase
MAYTEENWKGTKKILVILAHPDDPEFFCGGTIARWTSMGHIISYCLLTRGDKGERDFQKKNSQIAHSREIEQEAAARVLNVQSVRFLDQPDGYLIPDISLRREVARVIREEKPNIIVTCDPTNYFPNETGINHPDHRAAGQVVIDAVFPAAGSAFFFPDLLVMENLEPHSVDEVWMSLTSQPNTILDVTPNWVMKIKALREHRSQVGDPDEFEKRMLDRRSTQSTPDEPHYEEKFRRFVFKS